MAVGLAVFGGIAVSDLLKFWFAGPLPISSLPAAQPHKLPKPATPPCQPSPSDDRGASGAEPILVAGLAVYFIVLAALLSDHCRRQPRLPWRSLSDRCSRRLGYRCGLGDGVLGADHWLQQGGRAGSVGSV